MLQLKIPGEYNKEAINKAIKRVQGSMIYSSARYQIISEDHGNTLLIQVEEKPPQVFQFGAHYDSDFKAGILFNFTQRYKIGKKIAFISMDAIVSNYQRYKVENTFYSGWKYKPGKSRMNFIPNFSISYTYQSFDPYSYDSVGNIINNFHYIQSNLKAFFFYELGKNANMYLGSEYQYSSKGPTIVNQPVNENSNWYSIKLYSQLKYDSYDDKWLPKTGTQMNISFKYGRMINYEEAMDPDFFQFYFSYSYAWKIAQKFSLIPKLYTASIQGDDIQWDNQLFLGGVNNTQINLFVVPFAGYSYMELPTKNLAILRSDFQWNFIGDHYLTAKVNIGNSSEHYKNLLSNQEILFGGGISYTFKSLLGPVELSVLKANERPTMAFVNLGFWF